MKFPTTFTYLSFYFNSLIDEGKKIEVEDLKTHLEKKDLFDWMKIKYRDSLDISLFSPKQLSAIENLFLDQYESVDANRKFGVQNNGLCFLVAYCPNLIQYGESQIKEMQPDIF